MLILVHLSTNPIFECQISTRGGNMIYEQHQTRDIRSPKHASTIRDRFSRARHSIEQEENLETLSASQPYVLRSTSRPSYSDNPWCLFAATSSLEALTKTSCAVKWLSSLYSMLSFQYQIEMRFAWRLGSNQKPPLKLHAHKPKEHPFGCL